MIESGALLAKLRIGQPWDRYEQEADRVAEAVIRMPEVGRQVEPEDEEEETLQTEPLANQITPLVQVQRQEEPEKEETLQAKPLAEEITPLVQRQVEPEEEEEELQAKATSVHLSEVTPQFRISYPSLKGGSQPLPESDRAYFEPRFGYDFSHVRLHTDTQAAESARAVNARAFTVGRDVVFGAGQFAPGTSGGRRLMAHEWTHVVQQSDGGLQPKIGIGEAGAKYNHETNQLSSVQVQRLHDPGDGGTTRSSEDAKKIYTDYFWSELWKPAQDKGLKAELILYLSVHVLKPHFMSKAIKETGIRDKAIVAAHAEFSKGVGVRVIKDLASKPDDGIRIWEVLLPKFTSYEKYEEIKRFNNDVQNAILGAYAKRVVKDLPGARTSTWK